MLSGSHADTMELVTRRILERGIALPAPTRPIVRRAFNMDVTRTGSVTETAIRVVTMPRVITTAATAIEL